MFARLQSVWSLQENPALVLCLLGAPGEQGVLTVSPRSPEIKRDKIKTKEPMVFACPPCNKVALFRDAQVNRLSFTHVRSNTITLKRLYYAQSSSVLERSNG